MLRVSRAAASVLRRPARFLLMIAPLLAAAALAPLGCKDDDDDDSDGPPPDLAIAEVAGEAFPALADDVVRVRFSRDAVASEATDLSLYAVESPPGNALPLAGATAAYDPATFTVAITFAGASAADAVNLAAGALVRVAAAGIHAAEDGGVLPAGSAQEGAVGGTNAAPAVVSVTPDTAPSAGGVEVTVAATGLTFAADTSVEIGGTPLSNLVLVDALTARGRAGRHAPGAADVTVRNSNGAATAPGAFTFVTPFPLFEGALTFFTEDQPFGIDSGDLDGDGLADMAVVNFISTSVTVHRGRGNGDFDPPISLPTGQSPADVLIADVDGNGFGDLVYANSGNTDGSGNGSVSVRLGSGGLAFSAPTSTTVARSPQALAIADLDGDSDLDVAAVNRNSASLSVLLGDGTGAFVRRLPDIAIAGGPNGVAAADWDGDGDTDLATANGLDAVSLLQNDGAANFTLLSPNLTAGDLPQGIAAGDVDADGFVDLVTANLFSSDASVFFSSSGGAFASQVLAPLGVRPIQVQLADLFGTGATHVVAALNLGFGFAYSAHAGARTFAPPTFVRTARGPQDLAVRPLAPGALPSVVTANREADTFTVVTHREDGSLRTPLVIAAADEPLATELGDFDENGTLDIAVVAGAAKSVSLLLGDGAGGFAPGISLAAGDAPSALVARDFDGDAHLDIVVTDMFRNTVLFFKGDGAGGLAAPVGSLVGSLPEKIAAIDLDADGDLDVCTTLTGTLTIGVALNDGAGNFVLPQPQSDFGAGGEPKAVFPGGDFDGDGNLDLVVGGDAGFNGQIGVLYGDGAGIFNEFRGTLTFEHEHAAAMADLNADGIPDIVCAGRDEFNEVSRVRVIIGDGTRAIPPSGMVDPRNYAILVGSSPEHLVVADVDYDGDPDLVVTLAATTVASAPVGSGTIGILLNDGAGRFTTSQLIASGFQTFHVSVGDVNGDGSADVVGADSGQDTLSIYFGRG